MIIFCAIWKLYLLLPVFLSPWNKILMPAFPGQLRYIRKNLFHAVYVIDPATVCGLEASLISVLSRHCQPFFPYLYVQS